MGVLRGGGGGQTGRNVANRGNSSPFLDFCPNVVTLAQKKLSPPHFGCAESKKARVRAWGDGGEALPRAKVRPFAYFLLVFCMRQTRKNSTFTYFHYCSHHEWFLCIWAICPPYFGYAGFRKSPSQGSTTQWEGIAGQYVPDSITTVVELS